MRRPGLRAAWLTVASTFMLSACADLMPPRMPDNPPARQTIWLEQGWTAAERDWFHHADQGVQTFRMPFEWFVALEQPGLAFEQKPLLSDQTYLDRFGFVPSGHELPVGFARSPVFRDQKTGAEAVNPASGARLTGIGLTCAACHTGRMTYNGTELFIDGGPSVTNLGAFSKALGLAVLYTEYVPGRFDRFAARVLGTNPPDATRARLRDEIDVWLATGKREVDLEKSVAAATPEEGFTRLDALNRIGNQAFAVAPGVDKNYAPAKAPAHYAHLWEVPWFAWMHYNNAIMQPMAVNIAQTLGVNALTNLTGPGPKLFDTSADLRALDRIQRLLAGAPPKRHNRFTGLRAPKWPAVLPPIDQDRAAKGKILYAELCQGCHLPAPDSPAFWNGPWWHQIDGKGERYLDTKLIGLDEIGTDRTHATTLAQRRVELPESLGVATTDYVTAIGALAGKIARRWYGSRTPPIGPAEQARMDGNRPNRVQTPLAYRARPLSGIWAAPPYLHNGSVPTLYDLLSPAARRPAMFALGGREFDPVKVGYRDAPPPDSFILDTSRPGNDNKGHEFRDASADPGVIGRALGEDECLALVEYLKTL